MSTYTHRDTINVNTNGLGTVIRVPVPKDNRRYNWSFSSNDVVLSSERFWVFFKPNPGVMISGITRWSSGSSNGDYWENNQANPIEHDITIV